VRHWPGDSLASRACPLPTGLILNHRSRLGFAAEKGNLEDTPNFYLITEKTRYMGDNNCRNPNRSRILKWAPESRAFALLPWTFSKPDALAPRSVHGNASRPHGFSCMERNANDVATPLRQPWVARLRFPFPSRTRRGLGKRWRRRLRHTRAVDRAQYQG
jgi:hypothetical protein